MCIRDQSSSGLSHIYAMAHVVYPNDQSKLKVTTLFLRREKQSHYCSCGEEIRIIHAEEGAWHPYGVMIDTLSELLVVLDAVVIYSYKPRGLGMRLWLHATTKQQLKFLPHKKVQLQLNPRYSVASGKYFRIRVKDSHF